MVRCTHCKIEQPESEYHKRKHKINGLDSWCKSCKKVYRHSYFTKNIEKEKRRARIKAWKLHNIQISFDRYRELLEIQQSKCNICGIQLDVLHVDHDHTTGNIRGLLCVKCNQGLGQFNDSCALLTKAIQYLEKHNDNTHHYS